MYKDIGTINTAAMIRRYDFLIYIPKTDNMIEAIIHCQNRI